MDEIHDEIHDECGVFGVYSSENRTVAHTVYYGLYALQHRGQESGGIAVAFAAPAAIGAFSENKENFGKAMIFVAMGEGVAIYGLLISIIMIFMKL